MKLTISIALNMPFIAMSVLCMTLLTGCGQKGKLYHPQEEASSTQNASESSTAE
jgi:predicted small lipoprotein YifL